MPETHNFHYSSSRLDGSTPNTMTTNMKPVKNYEQYFLVSESGEIYSLRTKRMLKIHINNKGYCVFSTRLGGRKSPAILLRVHRLVAETFIPYVANKPYVNHIDGNKQNNHVSNLEWTTSGDNNRHAWAMGLQVAKKGTDNDSAKLSESDILYIKRTYIPYSREFGTRALAKKFNVHRSTISSVVNNKSYTNIIFEN